MRPTLTLELKGRYQNLFAKIEASREIEPALLCVAEKTLDEVQDQWQLIESICAVNQIKVIEAYRRARLTEADLAGGTGYGYNDAGREKLEGIYADVFRAEAALVRPQFVSGTHAIAVALLGLLEPGDELLSATGTPYDTLKQVIGIEGQAPGSLKRLGVGFRQVDLTPEGLPDLQGIADAIQPSTKAVFIQRSRGYSWRPSVSVQTIGEIIRAVKSVDPRIICIVDNCYGELVEDREPTEVGADIVAGSLIKNPGGGLAPTGGYLVGRKRYVQQAACRLSCPGIGASGGATLGTNRWFLQGLFMAPRTVAEALKGAVYAARFFTDLDYQVSPLYDEPRTDIIQAIKLGDPDRMMAFCQGVQNAGPVEPHLQPEPYSMPGYSHRVIMAAGSFTQGASIELSADGPMREPYAVYLQGGLAKEHVIYGVLLAAQQMASKGLLSLKT